MHPSEIKIGQYELTVYDLFLKIKANELIIESNKAYWDEVRNSKSIESIFLGLTMTPIYVDAAKPEEWIVLDGGKRLNAIYEYISGNFLLNGLEFLEDLENKYYESLPKSIQRKLQEAKLTIYSFNQGISPEVRLSLIKRVVPDIKNSFSSKMLQRLLNNESEGFIESLSVNKLNQLYKVLDKKIKTDTFFEKLNFMNIYFSCFKEQYYENYDLKLKNSDLVLYINSQVHLIRNMEVENIWNKGIINLIKFISNSNYSSAVNNEIADKIEYFIFCFGYSLTDSEIKMIFFNSDGANDYIKEFFKDKDSKSKFTRSAKPQRINILNKILIENIQ